MPITTGELVLCDLGEARILQRNKKQDGLIMPNAYRAPEILLDMEWDEKADIWAVGQTVCSFFWVCDALWLPYMGIYRHGVCSRKDIYSQTAP